MYATGGRAVYGLMTNRVAVEKPLTAQSVNGPQFNVIQGYQVPGKTNGTGAIRCVYLTNGAVLSGYTLTNGATRLRSEGPWDLEGVGGGVYFDSTNNIITNCVFVGNPADYGGGGAYGGSLYRNGGRLYNCTFTRNSVVLAGGGVRGYNCILTGNFADQGGGAAGATLHNSVLANNSAGRV